MDINDEMKKRRPRLDMSKIDGMILDGTEQQLINAEFSGYNIEMDINHKVVIRPNLPANEIELLSNICREMNAHSFTFISLYGQKYRYFKSTNSVVLI